MKITVFTPTYNRAYIIENLYHSLQQQTCTDFEWLVIDDGSSDNTGELFAAWQQEDNAFPIRYYYFENCGKPKEINRALDLAEGELFFTVDSDDLLTSNAVELILRWAQTIPQGEKFCAFAGSDGDMNGIPTNPIFHKPFVDATFFDRDPNCPAFIGYDRPWVFYTKIHKQYKYPEFPGERFITEAVAWNRMAHDGYMVRCFDDVIYLWEHQPEGYTARIAETLTNNPQGFGLWKKELLQFQSANFWERLKTYRWFYHDLRHKYSPMQIAGFIGAPTWQIKLIHHLSQWKHR